MTMQSDPLRDAAAPVVRTCSRCQQPFSTIAVVAFSLCGTCVEAEAAAELEAWRIATTAGIDGVIEMRMRAAGMRDVEIAADSARVPTALKRALPSVIAKAIAAGREPPADFRGFGLSGGQGIGKTMCMAALLRARTRAIIGALIAARAEAPSSLDAVPWDAPASFLWANWPDRSAWMRQQFAAHGGGQVVDRFVASASSANLLILDDIGRERMTKAYDEDFAVSALDRIIDARSRQSAPTLWTSNLTREGIARRYGAAMTSRLLGLAPAAELPRLPDLRLSATPAE